MNRADDRFAVELEVPVAWGDMDAFGHVNNVVYFRWFESGRIAYFQKVDLATVSGGARGPILARATCDFRLPLTFPDMVTVRARVTRVGTTSFTMNYQLTSAGHGGKVAAEGEGIVVMVDYESGATCPVSAELRQRIEALESGG